MTGRPQGRETQAAMLPTPGSPEKAAVRSMFDRIAPRYDLLNRVLSCGIDVRWRRRAVDLAELAGQARVLDVCTGTADLLIEALERSSGHSGVGVDIVPRMLAYGLRKLRRHGLQDRGGLVCGDGESLPVPSVAFDAVLVAFGIRNIGEPGKALAEMHRALRSGGRLVVLEFSIPKGLLGRVYRFYFTRILPRVGGLISGDPGAYAYLPASVGRFPEPGEFKALMESVGFQGVAARPLTGGIAHLYRGDRPR
jgi:demethylmenaquinone methyltransferase/2-methoxy-6-polyprenyl-1,4-benzoquinol methylase